MDELNIERPGACYLGGGRTAFEVWAPRWERLSLLLNGTSMPMERGRHGYFRLEAAANPGDRYRFVAGDRSYPDPASLSQPDGVHGDSEVLDTHFEWTDAGWRGMQPERYVFYELHVGTFSREGTFDGVVPLLDELRELGVTAIELMPIAQFPGRRNWGYDGTYPYAAQHSYGGLRGLQRLVNACHARGMAVVLDVVYNHLGPEGNYAPVFGDYFTGDYHTPWGAALNFDGHGSDEVRRFFIASAVFWARECHIDAFRLDAIHTIKDAAMAVPFIEELGEAVHREAERAGRRVHLFAETSRNDPRYIEPREHGGMGLDGQWNDDFQHALHALLTGERQGYYVDYGSPALVARCFGEGYAYQGEWSDYYGRRQGRASGHIEPGQLVVFGQNHDQVGNRARSDRLTTLVEPAKVRMVAAAVILSPYLPLLFMGEEYGEIAPFWYFVDHGDPALLEAVRRGRAREFESFGFSEGIADPAAEATFEASRPDRRRAEGAEGGTMLRYYRELLLLRRELPALQKPKRERMHVEHEDGSNVVVVHRWNGPDAAALLLNFGGATSLALERPGAGHWQVALDSQAPAWGGTGPGAKTEDGDRSRIHLPEDSAVLVSYRVTP